MATYKALTTSADTLNVSDGKGMIVAPNVYAALRGMSVMTLVAASPCISDIIILASIFMGEN